MSYKKNSFTAIYPSVGGRANVISGLLAEVANVQNAGGVCAWLDGDHGFPMEDARRAGVEIEELLISQPDTAEQTFHIEGTLIRSGTVDLVVTVPPGGKRVDRPDSFLRALSKSNTALVEVRPEFVGPAKPKSAPLFLSLFTINDVRDTGAGTYLGTVKIGGIEFHCELTAVCDPTEDEFGGQEVVDPYAYPGFEKLLVAFEPDGGFETIAVRNHPVMENGDYVLVIYPYSRS